MEEKRLEEVFLVGGGENMVADAGGAGAVIEVIDGEVEVEASGPVRDGVGESVSRAVSVSQIELLGEKTWRLRR